MATAATADLRSLPPGYRFAPKEKELVEFYLLPRARGLPDLFPGVDIIEDDTAASTRPWELFKRHNRGDEDEPYFFVHSKAGARQDRVVDGGFKWNSQKRFRGALEIGGEQIQWSKHLLSLQHGDSGSGSLGWVMHEYTIAEPRCASVKICHIAFTGHGQKRKRIPEGYDDCQSKRARVAAEPRRSNQETEQVCGAVEQLHGDDVLGESATQPSLRHSRRLRQRRQGSSAKKQSRSAKKQSIWTGRIARVDPPLSAHREQPSMGVRGRLPFIKATPARRKLLRTKILLTTSSRRCSKN